MKIGVFSDIHSNNYALNEIFKAEKDINKWLCAGDFCGLFPNVNETINSLIENDVIMVLGNHENSLINSTVKIENSYTANEAIKVQREAISKKNMEFLLQLKPFIDLEINEKKIHITHELQPELGKYTFNFKALTKYFKYDIIIFGHTHLPLVQYLNNSIVINPGSLGFPVDLKRKGSYMILDLEKMEVKIKHINYSKTSLINDIKKNNYNHKLIKYISNNHEWI